MTFERIGLTRPLDTMEPLAVQFALSCKPLAKSNQDASAAAELNLLFRTALSSCSHSAKRGLALSLLPVLRIASETSTWGNSCKRHFPRKKYAEWSIQMKHFETWSHRIMPKVFTSITDCLNKCFEHTWAYCTPQLLGGRRETLGKAVAPTNCCADSPATDKTTWEEPNHKSVLNSCIRLCRTPGSRLIQTARVFAKYIVSVSLQSLMRISCMTSTFSWIIST